MVRRAVSWIMLTLLLVSTLTFAFNIQPAKADWTWTETIYIRADGRVDPDTAPISSVDNITYTLTDNIVGDVPVGTNAIVVQKDNIVVNGSGYTLQGTGSGTGITLSGRSNVTTRNTRIAQFACGVYFSKTVNSRIENVTATKNGRGIWLSGSSGNAVCSNTVINNEWDGVRIDYSSGNTVSANTAAFNYYGIELSNSNLNTVSGNTATNNTYGILLFYSSGSTVSGNTMKCNRANFGVLGFKGSDFSNEVDLDNLADGKPIYYIRNALNTVYDASTNASTIYIIDSKNVTVKDLTLTKNYCGVYFRNTIDSNIENITATNNEIGIMLDRSSDNNVLSNTVVDCSNGIFISFSSGNLVSGNTVRGNSHGVFIYYSTDNIVSANAVTGNWAGIVLQGSSGNTISGNIVRGNDPGIWLLLSNSNNTVSENNCTQNDCGILLHSSSDNKFCHNNVINNRRQVELHESQNNIWDDRYPSGGNYWSHYTDVDLYSGPYQNITGSDGIWDHPYLIDANNRDNYPLVRPWTPSPTERVEELIETIETWNLPKGTEKSLTLKLEETLWLLEEGNENGAIHKLMDFINQVEAQREKKLTDEQADQLIAEAQRILDLIKG